VAIFFQTETSSRLVMLKTLAISSISVLALFMRDCICHLEVILNDGVGVVPRSFIVVGMSLTTRIFF